MATLDLGKVVPVKGEDYFTQQDIEIIKEDVLEEIDVPTNLSDLNEDSTHRLVTDTEKNTWNNKGTYSKPNTGIPKNDLESSVQTSLGKADSALQAHQDISGKLDTSKVKNVNSTIAGDVYDVRYINTMLGDVENLLGGI